MRCGRAAAPKVREDRTVPKFSGRTLTLLGDELVGWTLATIARLFDDEGIDLGPEEAALVESGQRRGLMRQYLASLDLNSERDTARLAEVFSTVLTELAARDTTDWYDKFVAYLRRDGFIVDSSTHRIVLRGAQLLPDEVLSALPDASAIRDHLSRLAGSIDSDPRLAISVAKDLVESTARLVLRQRGAPANESDDLPKLVGAAQRSLGLDAASVEGSSTKETAALKKILSSLTTLTQGLTELRNKVGPGHGRESVPTWVQPRHARLAAGAAQVWCQLVLETLEHRQR